MEGGWQDPEEDDGKREGSARAGETGDVGMEWGDLGEFSEV